MKFILILLISQGLWANVKLGIDNLFQNQEITDFLRNKSVAVLAHHASYNSQGEHLVDILNQKKSLQLIKIFTPEHGLRELADEWIEDGIDEKTSLPYFSLYLQDRQAPTAELLSDIDVIIIDLQDVGMRFYTFATTMAMTMEAASENGVDIIILDRPNPIGGKIEGPVLDSTLWGHLISYRDLPTRHGLTMGELAKFYYKKLKLKNKLFVSLMSGWNRSMIWEETGLPWRIPSPALPNPANAYLYSIVGPFESFNLAVGRGVDNSQAFHIIGAPWISQLESHLLAIRLNKISPSISFRSHSWVSTRAKYQGERLNGIQVQFIDYKNINGYEVLIKMLSIFYQTFGDNFLPTHTKNWTHRYLGNLEVWDHIKEKRIDYLMKKSIKSQVEYRKFTGGITIY